MYLTVIQMLLELNRPREAGDEFAKVLKAEPKRFRPLYGAARAAEIAGDSSRARELSGKLMELAPDSDRAELSQARIALQVSGGIESQVVG